MSAQEFDAACMRRALELAARGLDTTDPNPRVGCVLARDRQLIAEGWHQRAGEAHAEAAALATAGSAARGATAYVTLEPCASTGRVAPCTEALIAAGVARVVYAADDPNPRKAGGAARLRAAGIVVDGGVLAAEARELNPGFFKRHAVGLPWVRLKFGLSLDGRTALANGASRWITGDPARKDAQRYRARSSAVLTGVGTLLADDPALNVRIDGVARQPLRIVLDSRLRSPPAARVFGREGPSLVVTVSTDVARAAALRLAGAELLVLPPDAGGRVPLRAALQQLAARELNEIWVEAGATLGGALLDAGLVDELVLYYAGTVLGNDARGMAAIQPLQQLDARRRWRFHEMAPVGDDLRLTLRPV
jgi:diaminohydroxyphosphoribosylaminopyrimidine deaminase / 5-amino-6-(5-phosphoribosylamino)uracil reductase